MQAKMIRKVSSGKEWLEIVAKMKDGFGKEPETVEVKIEKTITLTLDEFMNFQRNLLEDSEIIKNNKELMYIDENGVWHVLEIRTPSMAISLLVEAEGYDYARYSAIRTED